MSAALRRGGRAPQNKNRELRGETEKSLLRASKVEGGSESPEMKAPKYPKLRARLTNRGMNDRISIVLEVLRAGGVSKEERDEFFAEARAAAEKNITAVAAKWVSVKP